MGSLRTLDIRYMRARNFVCFGPEGIEIFFNKFGNVVLVRGENLDVEEKEARLASNGVGKSTIVDILVYGLFGQSVKRKLTHKDVINNSTGGDLCVEIVWDKYRVVRCRQRGGTKTDTLEFWESERDDWDIHTKSKLGAKETQALIEEKLGMSYDAFINTVVFTDNNSSNFLECKLEAKRGIIDDLFALHKFRQYFEKAKAEKNGLKKAIEGMKTAYEQLMSELDAAKTRVEQVEQRRKDWKKQKEQEQVQIQAQIAAKERELAASDQGAVLAAYLDAQKQIAALEAEVPEKETSESECNQVLVQGYEELEKLRAAKTDHTAKQQALLLQQAAIKAEYDENKQLIDNLSNMTGCQCPTCFGIVKEENYTAVFAQARTEMNRLALEKERLAVETGTHSCAIMRLNEEITTYEKGIMDVKRMLGETRAELTRIRSEVTRLSKIKKPEVGVSEQIIEQQIEDLKQRLILKKQETEGTSPYDDMAGIAVAEVGVRRQKCQEKKDELIEAEDDIPHWEFLIDAYDSEIRKFVIADIIPTLNVKIKYWLQFLIDGKISCEFDKSLDETIHRAPYDRGNSAYVYNALSGGQRRRLNLAISQAFAHIMTLSSGVMPSLVFLDEVDLNVDVHGIMGIYKMIQEMARDKQVFITTHSKELLEMLDGSDSLNLVMKDGFTKMVPNIDSGA